MDASAASRLCNSCGLCCNGVMFHIVELQPADVAQDLVRLGLRIKRKKNRSFLQQPCPAHRESCCSIYDARPARCRLFECQQLQRVASKVISEIDALEKIRDVQDRVRRITDLLDLAGPTDPRRPLVKRCEKITAEPAFEPAMIEIHRQLGHEVEMLDAILDADFRIPSE